MNGKFNDYKINNTNTKVLYIYTYHKECDDYQKVACGCQGFSAVQ